MSGGSIPTPGGGSVPTEEARQLERCICGMLQRRLYHPLHEPRCPRHGDTDKR